MIPNELQEEYLHHLHKGHLCALKAQENTRQHMYYPLIDADIVDNQRVARNVSSSLMSTPFCFASTQCSVAMI